MHISNVCFDFSHQGFQVENCKSAYTFKNVFEKETLTEVKESFPSMPDPSMIEK